MLDCVCYYVDGFIGFVGGVGNVCGENRGRLDVLPAFPFGDRLVSTVGS